MPSEAWSQGPRKAGALLLAAGLVVLLAAGCSSTLPPLPEPAVSVEPESAPSERPPARSRKLTIHLDSQTFEYLEDGDLVHSGPVSTGSRQHPTPKGSFRVLSKHADKYSSKYMNYFGLPSWMPYALQFHGPYFIHESYMPGYPDSHGCVRLTHEDAKFLFERTKVGDRVTVKD